MSSNLRLHERDHRVDEKIPESEVVERIDGTGGNERFVLTELKNPDGWISARETSTVRV